MTRNFFNWLALIIAVAVADFLIPGISHDSLTALAVAALVLALFNAFLKPLLAILTLPFIVLTLGLFWLLVNAALLKLTAWVVPGFHVSTWLAAFLGAIIISLVHLLLGPAKERHTTAQHRRPAPSPPFNRQPPPGKGPVIDV